ncbi:MAG TPA: hypothetical protein DIU15_20840, partial [Deltaproteobacteria bacterium]|nr:hypothetical protein [Deltaproteobacteria bacterium]
MNTLHVKPIASLVLGLVMGLLVCAPGIASAYGEGTELLPSWEERAVHLFTDRLRVEPGADDPQFSDYSAVRPLVYNPDLNEAARFYADDMAANGCFPADHSSCDGTPFGERLDNFYAGQMIGENIALGSPTAEAVVVDGWLYSPPHRENMLSGQWLELGTGHGQADSGQRYWVQDFGSRGLVEEPITTSGIHWPLRTEPNDDVTFFLAVYDPDGDPTRAELVLDGDCVAMPLDRGVPHQGTYALTATTD